MSVTIRPYRRGGWEVDIRLRLPDGRRYRERERAPGTSKSSAQRWGEDRERHLVRFGPPERRVNKEVPTLKEFAPTFLNQHAVVNRQKPSGISSKESILKTHLVPELGSRKLDAIKNEDVQRLKNRLRDKAPKTVNNVLTTLSVLLKRAVEWEVIDTMPCAIKMLPVVRRESSFHDFDAYERLVDAARVKGWRTHLIVLLGGDAGLRAGEMVALHWSDVDFTRRRLCVRHSDWRGSLTAPKNGRVRYVPLTERLLTVLREYRHLRGPRVLCKDDGAPLSRQSAWTRVRRAVKLAGVPTGVHILRHTFCSHLAMQGAPSIAIKGLAGHQEMSVTQRYMHLSPDVLGSSIQLLESRPKRVERGDIVETASAQNGSGGRSIS
jgi:integrase